MGLMLWRRIPVISSWVSASNSTTTSYGPTTSRTIPPGMVPSLSTTSCILSGSALIKIYAFTDIWVPILQYHSLMHFLQHHHIHPGGLFPMRIPFSRVNLDYSTRSRYIFVTICSNSCSIYSSFRGGIAMNKLHNDRRLCTIITTCTKGWILRKKLLKQF